MNRFAGDELAVYLAVLTKGSDHYSYTYTHEPASIVRLLGVIASQANNPELNFAHKDQLVFIDNIQQECENE